MGMPRSGICSVMVVRLQGEVYAKGLLEVDLMRMLPRGVFRIQIFAPQILRQTLKGDAPRFVLRLELVAFDVRDEKPVLCLQPVDCGKLRDLDMFVLTIHLHPLESASSPCPPSRERSFPSFPSRARILRLPFSGPCSSLSSEHPALRHFPRLERHHLPTDCRRSRRK